MACFGFLGRTGPERQDRTREIVEIDLFEVSLTPAPANPDTRILSFKSTDPPDGEPEPKPEPVDPEQQRLRDGFRNEMLALLGAPLPAEDVLEREHKQELRELRRRCDRLRLEAALGFDPDPIGRAA